MEKKLLIVEDDSDIIDIIHNAVSSLFDQTDRASTLDEALKLLSQNTYSLIFLDYNLEFRSGTEIISALDKSTNIQNRNTPIVLVSGMVTPELTGEFPGRFTKVITKPFEDADLIEVANKILSK